MDRRITGTKEKKTEDTLPKLLLRNYRKWGDSRVAWRKKDLGIWREYSWKDCYEKVRSLSLGLISLGLEAGDDVCLLGDNSPEWYWAELAAQAAGGVVTGLFPDSAPQEAKYIIEHSQAKFAVVHDQEQVDKLLQIKDDLPLVRKVIYWDEEGLRHYDDPILMTFADLLQSGENYETSHPGLFEQNIARGKGDDIYMIVYTSGTTGLPKGALITHEQIISSIQSSLAINPAYESDEYVSTTLPGWFVEQGMGLTCSLLTGQKFNFAEESATVQQDLREISPHRLLYPSRLWEQLFSTTKANIADGNWLDRMLFNLSLPVAYKVADMSLAGQKANLFWRFLRTIGDLIIFQPLRDKYGLTRVRVPYTAGAMLGPDIFRFFRAIGINLMQSYGSTEGLGISGHTIDHVKFESVGIAAPGRILRISGEGEIMVDKQGSFKGYYRDPETTERALRGGWFHTGDGGYLDEDGHLIFIDRLEDMRKLSDGTRFSPQYIESRLRFSPYIRDALVLGGEKREFIAAIINVNFDNVSRWAERRKIPYTTFVDLSQKPALCELIKEEVGRVNRTLPANSRIKSFANSVKEFDPDEAELTRSRKLRRAFMEDRYQDLVKAIYAGKEEVLMEATVAYRDGRTGLVSANARVVHL